MQDLAALASIYSDVDTYLEDLRSRALGSGDATLAARTETKQRFNDQAYFGLCWGQLEVAIDDTCRADIRARRASSDWAVRRAWDLYNPDDKRFRV